MVRSNELRVDRSDLHKTSIAQRPLDAGPGEVLFEVERFALTANNITYAVAGDAMGYWNFFPAPDTWGCVPVWGYGRVIESRHPEVRTGERFYGYFPMATHLIVQPERVGSTGFVDAAAHRAKLPAVYNHYQRTPEQDREAENAQMLLRPLFMTSFLLDDVLADNGFFGARVVVLSSASSKTSIGLAFELRRKRRGQIEVVGLTSPAHADFVTSLDQYDRVVTYRDIETLDSSRPSAFVDMAGNAAVLRRVHEHFGNSLRHSCVVGVTHWQDAARSAPLLPGPAPTMFFAPNQIQKRNKDWGPGGLERHVAIDWAEFTRWAQGWLKPIDVHGAEAMQKCYLEMLEGRTAADAGLLISPGR